LAFHHIVPLCPGTIIKVKINTRAAVAGLVTTAKDEKY
jgi:hypothetical protein